MNIEQALKRIGTLQQNIKDQSEILAMLNNRRSEDKRVNINVINPSALINHSDTRFMFLDHGLFVEAVTANIEKNMDELKKLTPVIDMANAALKGVLS